MRICKRFKDLYKNDDLTKTKINGKKKYFLSSNRNQLIFNF